MNTKVPNHFWQLLLITPPPPGGICPPPLSGHFPLREFHGLHDIKSSGWKSHFHTEITHRTSWTSDSLVMLKSEHSVMSTHWPHALTSSKKFRDVSLGGPLYSIPCHEMLFLAMGYEPLQSQFNARFPNTKRT